MIATVLVCICTLTPAEESSEPVASTNGTSLVPMYVAVGQPDQIRLTRRVDAISLLSFEADVPGTWHSQAKQDELVHRLLHRKRSGFFVDLATNHPVRISNTRALERDFGWSGLCIEANPRQAPTQPDAAAVLFGFSFLHVCTHVRAGIGTSYGACEAARWLE